MRRKEFAARIWSKLLAFEKAQALLPRGGRVLAAVSGGPDSVCLAHYLVQRARPLKLWVGILHVHHGLRGREADRDLAFVERLGAKLGAPVFCARESVAAAAAARGGGIEEAGRTLRYQALAREAARLGCQLVATGHQLDDQAETVLLNLLRGTKLSALGGIPPRRALAPGVSLIRPLLPLSRAEIELYLERHELRAMNDRTNKDLELTRNWLRRRVLPELARRQPRVREHLAGIAEQVRALSLSDRR